MLYVKAEDGKVLEVIRSQFKDLKEVCEHSQRIFGMTSDQLLVTPPIHGSIGVLVSTYKVIGNTYLDQIRSAAIQDCHFHLTCRLRAKADPRTG